MTNLTESESDALRRIARENIVLRERRRRDGDVIRVFQRRWTRLLGPFGIFWRKPWRSSVPPWRGGTLAVRLLNFSSWVRNAHDCADPGVGCSCTGGYRFGDIPPWER